MSIQVVTFDRGTLGIPSATAAPVVRCEVTERGCFNCTSHGLNRQGYPLISVGGRNKLLSRVIYTAFHGPFDPALLIRHDCDNPPCINPAHLRLGTEADNSRDRKERDRDNRGSRHGLSKLTEEQVAIIKQTPISWNHELAEQFGVCPSLIGMIRNGRRWTHVTVANPAPPTTCRLPGVLNGRAKLREGDIETLKACSGYKTSRIAERFGISKTQFHRIKRGESWVSEDYVLPDGTRDTEPAACIMCGGSGKREEQR